MMMIFSEVTFSLIDFVVFKKDLYPCLYDLSATSMNVVFFSYMYDLCHLLWCYRIIFPRQQEWLFTQQSLRGCC